MGKRIIQQARGRGSLTYRVRKKAFIYRVKYPMHQGEAKILEIVHSAAHSAPLIKLKIGDEIFYNAAFTGSIEGETIVIGGTSPNQGAIMELKNIPIGTRVYNIEKNPGDGGKMIRTAGGSAVISKTLEHNKISILMPNKKELVLDGSCRATVGVIAGEGKLLKPFLKAGRKFYKMKTKNKPWPRTSAVKMNVVDHPFGSGRGKRIKRKTARRNAPPGRKVGHLRPRRTGKRK